LNALPSITCIAQAGARDYYLTCWAKSRFIAFAEDVADRAAYRLTAVAAADKPLEEFKA